MWITATPLSLTRWSMLEKPTHLAHQLCLESVIIPLLKEELETWHHPSREEKEQGETQREMQT